METLHELHRGCHLLAELVEHRLARRVGRVEVAGDVGDQRDARRPHVETLQRRHERHRCRSDDGRVERVAHRDPDRLHVGGGECVDGCEHGVGGAADHRLVVGVDVGDDDVPGGLVDDSFDLVQRTEHGRHRAVVFDRQCGHLTTTGTHRLERGGEGERPGGDERAVLAQAVSHHHVGLHSVRGEQSADARIGREDGGLGDLGLQQLLLELSDRVGIVTVDEDVRRQRAAQQWGHHVVGLTERLGDDRLARAQLVEHVDVLRALTGVEERHLRGGAATDEHALLAQHPVDRRIVTGECPDGLVELGGEVSSVCEVDRKAHRGTTDRPVRARRSWGDARLRVGERRTNLREQIGVVAAPEYERTARWRLCRVADARGGPDVLCRRRLRHRCAGEHPRRRLVAARHMLLQHDMEVRAAEAERAHATAPHVRCRGRPVAQRCVHDERGGVPVDVGVRIVEVETRWEHLVVQAADHLEHAGRAGRCLQVADVRLDRTEGDAPGGRTCGTEDVGETLQFGRIADAGGGPVGLDRRDRRRVFTRDVPRALHGQLLADRVGRRDALTLAIARAADPEDDGVDLVAVALGVLETLEHEQCGALTHHEAVGTRIEGSRASCGQGADLAELHERGDAHVVVDSTRDCSIEAVIDEALDRDAHRGEAGRARRIGREVGTAEVEQVGDPAGHHVREFTGHGVLVDLIKVSEKVSSGLVDDVLALIATECRERIGTLEVAHHFGKLDAQVGFVVLLPADRVPDDHGHVVRVDRPIGPSGIDEGGPCGTDRPPLTIVHLVCDLRRDGKLPADRIPGVVTHPAADGRVGLVGFGVIRREVQRRVPPLGGHLADRVATTGDVRPERVGIDSIGHDRPEAHHRNGGTRDLEGFRHVSRLL